MTARKSWFRPDPSTPAAPGVSEQHRAMARGLGLSRRQMLAAATGVAAAATVGGVTASPAAATASGQLIPAPRRGIILYTVRDAISRNPLTTDQPSGFKEVFEYLGGLGYRQVEFAGYGQNANAEGGNVNNVEGAKLLRTWLDDNGLEAEGNHGSVPSTINDTTLAAFDTACEMAAILGMRHVGTGGDPTGSSLKPDWDAAAERWNILGERAWTKFGLKLYTHNHDAAYGFLLDSPDETGALTRSTGVRKLEYFLSVTDPKYVWLEMDIYWAHVAQFKHKSYTQPDGSTATNIFDPAGLVAQHTMRYPLFHAKDGVTANNANGYDMVPFGLGDIDYATFFRRVGAKGSHNPMYEQDNAASWGQGSLDNARIAIENMAALRG